MEPSYKPIFQNKSYLLAGISTQGMDIDGPSLLPLLSDPYNEGDSLTPTSWANAPKSDFLSLIRPTCGQTGGHREKGAQP